MKSQKLQQIQVGRAIGLTLGLIIGIAMACGQDNQDSAARNQQNQSDAQGSVTASCESRGTDNDQLISCINYENLAEQEVATIAQSCTKSSGSKQTTKEFFPSKSCPIEARLGGCRIVDQADKVSVTWIFSSGEASVDEALIEIAKENCAAGRKDNGYNDETSGVWLEP